LAADLADAGLGDAGFLMEPAFAFAFDFDAMTPSPPNSPETAHAI
jgi:hypothetical protein